MNKFRLLLIKELTQGITPEELEEAINLLTENYEMERAANELSASIVKEIDYYRKDLELSRVYNHILLLKQLKRKHDENHKRTISKDDE